jgi:hypothetical protein
MEVWTFEQKKFGNYGEASTKGSSITIIYKVTKIPLMIENHLRYKANKR